MKLRPRPLSLQSGMAVITAMLLVALAASAATFLLWRQQLWLGQVESIAARAQTDALARAAIEWRRRGGAGQITAPFAEADAIETAVSDPQGLFNLNNVLRAGKPSEPDLAVFRRLLSMLKLPEALADALLDAIDTDSDSTFPGGAEDLDYLAMDPPRRAPNRLLLDVSSLGRIKGFTAEAIARLAPYVTALPESTAVNVNSAPAEVLRALIPGLDEAAARAIVAERSSKPFDSLEAFRAKLPEAVRPPSGISLGLSSTYFVVATRVRLERAVADHRALIGIRGAKHEGIVWRTEGFDG
jgi:general secretion pathway protein K